MVHVMAFSWCSTYPASQWTGSFGAPRYLKVYLSYQPHVSSHTARGLAECCRQAAGQTHGRTTSSPKSFAPFSSSKTLGLVYISRLTLQMAEVGAVIAVVQLTDRVIVLCKYWIEAVRDAPADLRSILLEVSMLRTIFQNVEFLVSCDDASSAILKDLSQPNGSIEHCREILTALVGLLPTDSAKSGHSVTPQKENGAGMAARLAWPFRQSKARKLLEELGRAKMTINLSLTTDSA